MKIKLNPLGTLTERIRAGGAGVPAFYTTTGVGTAVRNGKELGKFNGFDYFPEQSLSADLAPAHSDRGNVAGEVIKHMTARNFNPIMAIAAHVTVAEIEELVELGGLAFDQITPGRFL